MKEEKKITEILSKVERYCRYQERCKSEVEKKLVDLEVTEKMKKSILYELSKKNISIIIDFPTNMQLESLEIINGGKLKSAII